MIFYILFLFLISERFLKSNCRQITSPRQHLTDAGSAAGKMRHTGHRVETLKRLTESFSLLLSGPTTQVLLSSCVTDLSSQLSVVRGRSQDAKTGKNLKGRLQKLPHERQQLPSHRVQRSSTERQLRGTPAEKYHFRNATFPLVGLLLCK